MSRKIFGIDISQQTVTAVVVQTRIKGNSLEDYTSIPISVENDFDNEVGRALETITDQMDISGAVCVAALPVAFVSFRNLTVPFREKKKIRQILPFELETTLPYAPEDIVADFSMPDLKDGRDHSSILAAAVEKERLESFLNILKTYSIEPDVVTVSGFAVSQCLNRFTEEDDAQLLLNIDPNRTTMTLNVAGQVMVVRSFAGRITGEGDIRSIVSRVGQTLAALEEGMGTPPEIKDVRLTGSASQNAMVTETIEKVLDMPATPLDLMTHSGIISPSSTDKQWQAINMDGALSLALAGISGLEVLNFRQGKFAVQKAWVEHKKDIVKTGILAVVVAAIFLSSTLVDYYTIKKRAEGVQKEIVEIFKSSFPDVTKIVDPLHQMRLKLDEVRNSDLYPEVNERSVDAIDILNDISRLIPTQINVALNSIIIGSDSILISGDTETFNAVDDMKSRLEKAEAFKTVSISSANMNKSGNRVRFKLKVTI
jgi:type II secretion system protein L